MIMEIKQMTHVKEETSKIIYLNKFYKYKGYGIYDSWCEVEIHNYKDNYLVVLTEPSTGDSGTSVTNAVEDITTKLYQSNEIFPTKTLPENIIWIEHYNNMLNSSYDLVKLNHKNKRLQDPMWEHIGSELTNEKIKELFNELDR